MQSRGPKSRPMSYRVVRQRQAYKRVERRLAGKRALSTDAISSRRMSRVSQRGTAPELLVRKACSALGLRYTTKNRDLPGSPDLANRSKRWAIFVHGCFWHRHAGCTRATTPKSNVQFWMAKFARNQERDAVAERQLQEQGYRVLVVWECDVKRPDVLTASIEELLKPRRTAPSEKRPEALSRV